LELERLVKVLALSLTSSFSFQLKRCQSFFRTTKQKIKISNIISGLELKVVGPITETLPLSSLRLTVKFL
jgi:hypothetical protein